MGEPLRVNARQTSTAMAKSAAGPKINRVVSAADTPSSPCRYCHVFMPPATDAPNATKNADAGFAWRAASRTGSGAIQVSHHTG